MNGFAVCRVPHHAENLFIGVDRSYMEIWTVLKCVQSDSKTSTGVGKHLPHYVERNLKSMMQVRLLFNLVVGSFVAYSSS